MTEEVLENNQLGEKLGEVNYHLNKEQVAKAKRQLQMFSVRKRSDSNNYVKGKWIKTKKAEE
ncbi:hypothetical protein ACQKMI_22385 [Lysinibacillus sp. NPDC097214]|uniref:hypothetical protein n=1 Tax=Lysinibacillus sp. NPDC097214 TaxID=3390584 RepID=UPI003D062D18